MKKDDQLRTHTTPTMNTYKPLWLRLSTQYLALLLTLLTGAKSQARVLDDFNDNTKTAWTDFTFVPGFGLPSEADGKFRFEQPGAGRAIFSASQKTSETFELKEGRTVEFRVDLVEGGAKDSFAILAFLPTSIGGQPNSPGTLAGYGLAKSTTDVLITKGINKYFIADDGPAANLKNNNITLVLTLTVKEGSVYIRARALDKEDNDNVIWEKEVIDTPGADTLIGGADDPAAPFINITGYFTLYLYQDFAANAVENPYQATFDNAQVFINETSTLDDFDDNTKTSWTDFTFVPGFGLPEETEGQFRFEQPAAGRAIFSASQKTSRLFELKDGERLEFKVDVIEGGAKDSFAILAFIPNTVGGQPNTPGTLAGYGLAKSTTDVLITKGINKYFIADDGPAANLKNNNITLRLHLEGINGSVVITAQVLDKEDNNAVIWEKIVTDTPGADTLIGGSDDPAAPFLTSGYFTLYLYQDFAANAPENPYKIYYDNAMASAPPIVGNTAPTISEEIPANLSNFLPAATDISFKATDDQAIAANSISINLDGVAYTTANGLAVTGAEQARTATLTGKLLPNKNYTAVLSVTDSANVTTTKTLYFDTFGSEAIVVEAEDYNFGGAYFDNPVVIPEGSGPQDQAYGGQTGVEGTDFHETRTSPNGTDTKYRSADPIRMQRSLDIVRSKFAEAGGTESGVYDFDVGDIVAGEWLNYTRTFPSGAYEVYVRQALVNMATGESVLEQVLTDATQPDQTVKSLGSFLGVRTGFEFRNFALTDGSGQNKLRLNLNGPTTLRVRQVTTDAEDGARYQNYYVFVRVGDLEVQRAIVTSLSPTPDSTTDTLIPNIRVEIQNRDTTVKVDTLKLEVNGLTVTPQITSDAAGAVVTYTMPTLPNSETVNSATISFKDNQDVTVSSTWQFTFRYLSLDPANRVTGTPGERGFRIHVVQAPIGSALANSILRAEDQIKANSTIPRVVDVTDVATVINFNKKSPTSAGDFQDDLPVPGIPFTDPETGASNGLDDFALEAVGYLKLSKGVYRFGFRTDDGFKLTSGKTVSDILTPPLAFEPDGVANKTVDFLVKEDGIYPFRFLWYERGGDGYAELTSINIESGERLLINDLTSESAIVAYQEIITSTLQLQSSATVTGLFAEEPTAVVDTTAKTVTITAPAASRFFRLVGSSAVSIKNIKVEAGNVVLTYE